MRERSKCELSVLPIIRRTSILYLPVTLYVTRSRAACFSVCNLYVVQPLIMCVTFIFTSFCAFSSFQLKHFFINCLCSQCLYGRQLGSLTVRVSGMGSMQDNQWVVVYLSYQQNAKYHCVARTNGGV